MSDKTRKYIFYAIGEIFLVVIGILIALQVNNWNEARKQEQEALKMLRDLSENVEDTFISRSGFYENYMSFNMLIDSLHYNILNKSLGEFLDDKSYMENPFQKRYVQLPFVNNVGGFGYLYNENIKLILDNERLYPQDYNWALFMARRLEASFQSMVDHAAALNVIEQKMEDYLSSQSWLYKTDGNSTDLRVQFFENDSYFRNRLIRYRELQSNYMNQYDIYTKYLLFFWVNFQTEVEGKEFEELIPILESTGLERAKEVPCNSYIIEDPVHIFSYWSIVYNNTEEALDLFVRNPITNEQRFYRTLEPGEHSPRYTSYHTPYLQVGTNGTCQRQFETGLNSFILID